MKAIIKSMWINSAAIDLDTYFPEDPECFGLWIEFRAGFKDEESADDFRVLVCTPEWLRKEYGWKKSMWGRHMLVVFNYDLDAIKMEINQCVENCTGDNWMIIAQKISRFFAWEFEDYQS